VRKKELAAPARQARECAEVLESAP
jgi:hypothetical protein